MARGAPPGGGDAVTASREPLLKATVHYGYFVLQARATRGPDGIELTGVLENLGTGEKLAFDGREGLARMIEDWGRRSSLGGHT
jgi:hypothetical protein